MNKESGHIAVKVFNFHLLSENEIVETFFNELSPNQMQKLAQILIKHTSNEKTPVNVRKTRYNNLRQN